MLFRVCVCCCGVRADCVEFQRSLCLSPLLLPPCSLLLCPFPRALFRHLDSFFSSASLLPLSSPCMERLTHLRLSPSPLFLLCSGGRHEDAKGEGSRRRENASLFSASSPALLCPSPFFLCRSLSHTCLILILLLLCSLLPLLFFVPLIAPSTSAR